MTKKWKNDKALVDSLAERLFEILPMFPKKLLHVDELLRKTEMPLSNIQVLLTLEKGGITIGEISKRLSIAKPNVTPLVNVLRDQGFVVRERSEMDRRMVTVHLTEAGQVKLAEIRHNVVAQVQDWADDFSRSEMKELNDAIATVARIVNAMTVRGKR